MCPSTPTLSISISNNPPTTLRVYSHTAEVQRIEKLVKERLRLCRVWKRVNEFYVGYDKEEGKVLIHMGFYNRQRMIFTEAWFREQPDTLFAMISAMKDST